MGRKRREPTSQDRSARGGAKVVDADQRLCDIVFSIVTCLELPIFFQVLVDKFREPKVLTLL